MTLAQALRQAAGWGLERLDAQLLLLQALNLSAERGAGPAPAGRAWLLAHGEDALDSSAAVAFFRICERRAAGEPMAYITGHQEFFGLDLVVDPRVLIPRPDTETLVEWALELLVPRGGPTPHDGRQLLDLGTGSGAIALAIKSCRPGTRVDATDASADALAVARDNAARLSLDIGFRQAHWLEGAASGYDLIVSNPPYIAAGDAHLPALVHEPLLALAAGPDGLQALRIIAQQAPAHLRPGGWLLLEHGHDQADAVRALLRGAGLSGIASRRDLAGIERCSGGALPDLG